MLDENYHRLISWDLILQEMIIGWEIGRDVWKEKKKGGRNKYANKRTMILLIIIKNKIN